MLCMQRPCCFHQCLCACVLTLGFFVVLASAPHESMCGVVYASNTIHNQSAHETNHRPMVLVTVCSKRTTGKQKTNGGSAWLEAPVTFAHARLRFPHSLLQYRTSRGVLPPSLPPLLPSSPLFFLPSFSAASWLCMNALHSAGWRQVCWRLQVVAVVQDKAACGRQAW